MAHAVETMENNALFYYYFLCCLGHATMERLMIGLADETERRSQNAGPELPLDEREQRLGSTGLA